MTAVILGIFGALLSFFAVIAGMMFEQDKKGSTAWTSLICLVLGVIFNILCGWYIP